MRLCTCRRKRHISVSLCRLCVRLSSATVGVVDTWCVMRYDYWETRIEIRASRFTIYHQIRDRKYVSAILGVHGSALRPCGTKPVQRSIGYRSVCYLAGISYDRTQKDSRMKTSVEIGRRSRIPTPGALFWIQFRGAYSAADQDIFTKLVVLVENGDFQRAEWFNTLLSEIQDGRRLPSLIS